MTGTYDPDLNLLYVGTGNPDAGAERRSASRRQPVDVRHRRAQSRHGHARRGDFRPHRTTRTTGTRRKCRSSSTETFNGTPRKLVLQASRNGYYFVLDRTTGKSLLTTTVCGRQLGEGHRQGRAARSRIPTKSRQRDGRLVAPNEAGATNYRSPSFDPATGSARRQRRRRVGDLLLQEGARRVRLGGRQLERLLASGASRDRLSDREVQWSHDIGEGAGGAGVLTTATGADVLRRQQQQRAGAPHEPTAPRCGTRRSAASAIRRSPTSWTDGSMCSLAAAARSTRLRFRRRDEK